MKKLLPLLLLTFISFAGNSQNFYTLRGYVYNTDNQPLPGASLRIFDLQTGTQTNAAGQYELLLEQGLHRISVSYLGHSTQTIELVIDQEKAFNFFLEADQKLLDEVVVSVKKKDFSYEVVKNVIENKAQWQQQYQSLACNTYIKSVEEIKNLKPPKEEEDETPETPKDTLPKLNFFEASIKRYELAPNKIKEERTAVKKLGAINDLFYTSITDGTFDLYQNLQIIKKLGQNSLVSPFSTIGYISYKFKLLETYHNGERLVYRISIKPKEISNALYEGEIEVLDGLWAIQKVSLSVPKKLLLRYSNFSFEQQYELVDNMRVITKERFEWKTKEGSSLREGSTEVLHSRFVFDSTYAKNFFGNELGSTSAEAYKKDSAFWQNIRPKPLSATERAVVKAKELAEIRMNSKEYLDSIDAVFNKITFLKVMWSGVGHINRAKKTNWQFGSLPSLINPIAIGGWRMQYNLQYYKRFENRKQIRVSPYLNYGFLNRDLMGSLTANYFYNPVKLSNLSVSFGRNFDIINGSATIADVARRNNFFINSAFNIGHRTELFNGFYLNTGVQLNKREDFSNFKFSKLGDELFNGNTPSKFPTTEVLKTNFKIDFTPGQQYVSEPNQKVVLGSRYPTFSWRLTQAFQANQNFKNAFTYTEFNIDQTFNVGIFGTSQYRVAIGKFLDTTILAPMDYQYQRGGDKWWMSPSMVTYQLIPKTFQTFDWFLESHYEHQFNGFLISKIPLLNKSGIREMVGGGFLYVPERKYQYAELYGGLNRVLRLGRSRFRLGAHYVISQSNQDGFRSGFKFSFEQYNPERNTWSF